MVSPYIHVESVKAAREAHGLVISGGTGCFTGCFAAMLDFTTARWNS